MTQKNFVVHNGLTVGNIVLDVTSNSITGADLVDAANLNVGTLANLGNAGNIKIGGGLQGQLLQTDGNGNLSWYSFNPDSGLTCQVDVFTGAGTTDTYALSITPVNVNFVSVVIDGVTQLRSTYSLNQNILTIGANLPALARMEVTTLVGYGNSALQSTVDTYTGNGLVNTYTLSVTPPTIGSTTVVVDGVVQMKNTYSLDGGNITLGANLPANSVLEVTTLQGSNTTPNVANYANYANYSGTANTANSVAPANVTPTAWTSYTPLWTASATNPVIGDGTITGRYQRIGGVVSFSVDILVGSTTTFGSGDWRVSLPLNAQSTTSVVCTAMLLDNGTRWYNASAFNAYSGANSYVTLFEGATTVTATSPFTWANGDRVIINGTYETA